MEGVNVLDVEDGNQKVFEVHLTIGDIFWDKGACIKLCVLQHRALDVWISGKLYTQLYTL